MLIAIRRASSNVCTFAWRSLSLALAPVDVGERLAAGVAHDVAPRNAFCAPGRREAAGCHRGRGWLSYGLQATGVTSSGVPFLELIQPVAVSLHGHLIA
jgi:hypothetical protein